MRRRDDKAPTHRRTARRTAYALLGCLALTGCPSEEEPVAITAAPPAGFEEALEAACSTCHETAPPTALPKSAWKPILEDMYAFGGLGDGEKVGAPLAAAIDHYESKAPASFPIRRGRPFAPRAEALERTGLAPKGAPPLPGTGHVALLDLLGDERKELIACDVRHGLVTYARPWAGDDALRVVAQNLGHPCHASVCDLDGDGWRDLVVVDHGVFPQAADALDGRLLWLRRVPKGRFELRVLAKGLARPCEALPLDADGDGDLDFVVCEFGWRKTGGLTLLVNESQAPTPGAGDATPRFTRQVLIEGAGPVAVRAADLDQDGRPDLVVCVAQAREAVLLLRAKPGGGFEPPRELYQAPHPAWGSNRLEVCDLDGDGDNDLLVTNGDTLDDHLLKPYHGVGWLENQGDLRFERRDIAPIYGVHGVAATDWDGDGDLDVIACAFLPQHDPELLASIDVESILLLEQTEPGLFETRALARGRIVHPTLAVGDVEGDGVPELILGRFATETTGADPDWVELFKQPPRGR
jgi:hypothetical protein